MPIYSNDRTDFVPAWKGLACFAMAAVLAGCAAKNPLMDDAPVARASAQQSASAAATADSGNATNAVPTNALPDGSAVQTTRPTGLRKFLGVFSPYRVDVQQGNFISREMVDQLRDGMQRSEGVTREQVRFVLGTPLLTDAFHADRWDYVFRLQKRTGEVISSKVTVFFNNNRLERIDGGTLPTEQEYLAFIAGSAPGATRRPR
jgi:outer membrane protein assembly factor BamE